MSSIALSPNAAGTATFTVAAPGTSTNRTITLPDATGTAMLTNTPVAQAQLEAAMNFSGAAPVFACRAWVSFVGATATIRGSGNVASVVRNSAGNYTITFATAMPDANYAVVLGGDPGGSTGDKGPYQGNTTASSLVVLNYNTSGTFTDNALISVVVFR